MHLTTSGRRIGAGLAGLTLAAATAVVVTVSPAANANVDAITVSSPVLNVGGTYTLHASLSGASAGLLVYWSDNGESLTPAGKVPWPIGQVSVDWTPRTSGQHIITATQGSNTETLIVTVTDGSTTPPVTTTPPTTVAPPTTQPPTTTTPAEETKPGSGSSGGSSGSGTGSASRILRGLFSGSSSGSN
ncbi:hypothetical protein [Nocardia crassostreae]|uniref:hypothetical protein n=1 Tax=Nocardia crassostreae TaxID=53428 RepID=UPI00082AFC30|nr:hypothetical protein [Nocardia crassostreae]